MEDNNHIKFLVGVYHLGRLYLNLKDQDVQYGVLVSNWPTNKKKKALTYLFETRQQIYISKYIINHIKLIKFNLPNSHLLK